MWPHRKKFLTNQNALFYTNPALGWVQSLPSFFVIALISTSTASTLFVYRKHPTSNLIAVQDQQLTTQNYFYALKPAMQPAIMDLFSSLSVFFVGQRHPLVQSLPFFFVFVLISTSSRLAFIPPPFA